jgi:hypothetical protein
MSKFARSARGTLVNFDELMIKQALSSAPAPVSVNQRRKFINDKDGISEKRAAKIMGETANAAMAAVMQNVVLIDEDDSAEADENISISSSSTD